LIGTDTTKDPHFTSDTTKDPHFTWQFPWTKRFHFSKGVGVFILFLLI